ncbi:FKBP-type peptidyl-prolyl cis-trans isomerase [Derxia lacustris]|uniref:FKBP-type peptidyl-prolyl cis-trans isomerase n=1 Tax=Derxia lacustris TaxID=764842 RepID=UPI001F448586|nr:FKBP-type peptidyl-prolyl cis-trans isomerase [Derxia lacustris]
MKNVVSDGAYLTLHYRLSWAEGEQAGQSIVSTFEQSPATLQLGGGQLSPGLEARLIGLEEGADVRIDLAPEEAFGPRNRDLVMPISIATFRDKIDPAGSFAVGDMVPVPGPNGARVQGVLTALTDEAATIDFNHPLAGRALAFEVKIIGVM